MLADVGKLDLLFIFVSSSDFKAGKNCFPSHGLLLNLNTIENFKECNKAQLLKSEGEQLHDNIVSGKCLEDPSLLVPFVLLSHAVNLLNFFMLLDVKVFSLFRI